jgi:hypothetical protein
VINSHPEGDVCRLRPESFSELARRLARTLLSLPGTVVLARGSRSALRPHQMMNRPTGWLSVCATVTAIL